MVERTAGRGVGGLKVTVKLRYRVRTPTSRTCVARGVCVGRLLSFFSRALYEKKFYTLLMEAKNNGQNKAGAKENTPAGRVGRPAPLFIFISSV